MADRIITTETVVREWDASGKLIREIATLVQTRTPEEPPKPPFGLQPPSRGDVA